MLLKSGARKKKRLDDPVEILPPSRSSLRKQKKELISTKVDKTEDLNSEEKSTEKSMVQQKSKIQQNTSRISIKAILSDQQREKKEKESRIDLPKETIEYDKLCLYWNQFAYQMKDQGMETFYNALVKRKPKVISNTLYGIVVDNPIQVDYIQAKLNDFIQFLRPILNNYELSIRVELSEEKEEEPKFLSGKEKFDFLASKNPNLHVLKSLFNLDIDL